MIDLLRVPLKDLTPDQRIHAIQLYDAKVKEVREANKDYQWQNKPQMYVISDDLGLKGVVNPVNGKRYDSKSQYEKDVKASGHHILGGDAKVETKRETVGDFDCRKELAQAIDQTGFLERKKR